MRARNLKPGFFKNEELAELSPLTRILFAGLWCMADREGRLEDRPKRIKAEILPYDDCDPNAMLAALHDARFILRYEADGAGYIQVLNFGKHQNPHIKEAASTIPAPCEHSANTVREPEEHGSCPADSLNLIPDSPSLTPDTTTEPARARATVALDTPYAVFSAFLEEIGTEEADVAPAWKKKQLGVAKRLVEQGFGAEKVRRYVRYMRSETWRTSPFDLFTVEKGIGTWEANGSPAIAEARASPNGRRPDPYAGIEEFKRRMDAIEAEGQVKR